MELEKVVAIVRTDADVESRLIQIGVPGITLARVKGFGEYARAQLERERSVTSGETHAG